MPKKELYQLAAEFRKARLWEQLNDTELFAVGMPDGVIGYVSVMGALGEHLALAVYPGSAGLETFRLLWQAHDGLRNAERAERMMGQDCVMCSFEKKAELRPRDLQEIRDYGLTYRGKQAYPFFQRFRPRDCPWYVEDDQDEERLRLSLLAGLEVARRLVGTDVQMDLFHTPDPGASKAELGFRDDAPFDREIPFLTPRKDGTFAWSRIPLPEPAAPAYASPRLTDEITLMRLMKQPKSGAWECGMFMYPEPVADGEEDADGCVPMPERAPHFLLVLLMVDHADGTAAHFGMTDASDYAQKLLDAFVEGVRKVHMPAEVLVRDERTRALLAGIAEQLGIRLTQAAELPLLDKAEDELFRSAEAGGNADIEAMVDDLLDSADPGALPDELRRQLSELLERNMLPGATAEKLRRFLTDKKNTPSTPEKKKARPGKKAKQRAKESYIVSVSLQKGCYRHVRIGAGDKLSILSGAILEAFGFDDDHAHAFFMDNRLWSDADSFYVEGIQDSGRTTKDYTLSDAGLHQGKPFKYLFDFGDEWVFQCKVLKVLQEDTGAPLIVRSAGYAPAQYGEPEDEEEQACVALPEIYPKREVQALYKTLGLPNETVKLLLRYFDAFANLYGILPLRQALAIYNRQNPPIGESVFAKFSDIASHEKHAYTILSQVDQREGANTASISLDREIVEDSLLMYGGDYEGLKAAQAEKPYYVPDKRELLAYADSLYFERNAEFLALRDYLRDEVKLPQERADDIADELQLHATCAEKDMNYILQDMRRMGLAFEGIDSLNAFITRYFDMSNNTRMTINRGHTPSELLEKTSPPRAIHMGPGITEAVRRGDMNIEEMRMSVHEMGFPNTAMEASYLGELDRIEREVNGERKPPAASKKTGRNDPCPCGSGRKFKHCCGKYS